MRSLETQYDISTTIQVGYFYSRFTLVDIMRAFTMASKGLVVVFFFWFLIGLFTSDKYEFTLCITSLMFFLKAST